MLVAFVVNPCKRIYIPSYIRIYKHLFSIYLQNRTCSNKRTSFNNQENFAINEHWAPQIKMIPQYSINLQKKKSSIYAPSFLKHHDISFLAYPVYIEKDANNRSDTKALNFFFFFKPRGRPAGINGHLSTTNRSRKFTLSV